MKEKIKQLIAEQLMQQSNLKLMMRNLALIDELTDAKSSQILDEIEKIEVIIEKLRKALKEL